MCNQHVDIEKTMPGLSVELNRTRIATIDLAPLEVLDVAIHGALNIDPKARLHSGSTHCIDGVRGSLIWIAERYLVPGDILSVRLDAACGVADRGRTIDEVYPEVEGGKPFSKDDPVMDENTLAQLRARPRLHDAFLVQVETSSGEQATAASDDLHTDFSFTLLWDRFRPDQARIRLASYCLHDVLQRTGGTTHLKTMLSAGDSAKVVLVR